MDIENLIRYLKARRPRRYKRGWRCPDEIAIAAFADGGLKQVDRQKVERHLAECDHCLEQVVFLVRSRKLDLAATVPAALLSRARELGTAKSGFTLFPAWTKVAAAGVAFVALVTVVAVRISVHKSTGMSSSVTPARAGSEIRSRSAPWRVNVVSPAPNSAVSPGGLEFRWEPVPGSLDYELRVLTAEGDVVWSGRTEKSLLKLPSDIKLESGRKYFVLIQANLADGKTIRSDAIAFTVRASN